MTMQNNNRQKLQDDIFILYGASIDAHHGNMAKYAPVDIDLLRQALVSGGMYKLMDFESELKCLLDAGYFEKYGVSMIMATAKGIDKIWGETTHTKEMAVSLPSAVEKNKEKTTRKEKSKNHWAAVNEEGKDRHIFVGSRKGVNGEHAHLIADSETGEIRIDRNDKLPHDLLSSVTNITTRKSGEKILITKSSIEFDSRENEDSTNNTYSDAQAIVAQTKDNVGNFQKSTKSAIITPVMRVDGLVKVSMINLFEPAFSRRLNADVVRIGLGYISSTGVDLSWQYPHSVDIPISADVVVYKTNSTNQSDREREIYSGSFSNNDIGKMYEQDSGVYREILLPRNDFSIDDSGYRDNSIMCAIDLILHTPEQGNLKTTGFGSLVKY